jgi:hypothetical protein
MCSEEQAIEREATALQTRTPLQSRFRRTCEFR